MEIKNTYYIKRGDTYLWTGTDFEVLHADELIETRPMLFVDEGKVLFKDGEEIGKAIWLTNGDTQDNYIETDEVIEDDGSIENQAE